MISECLAVLDHASKCTVDGCKLKRCLSMKNVWKHYKNCSEEKENFSKCPICKRVQYLLQYHAHECNNDNCTVVKCFELKKAFVERQRREKKFLTNFINFRLSAVPTIIEARPRNDISKPDETSNAPCSFSNKMTKI